MVAVAPAAHALRIVNYNILNYPSVNVTGRNPHFRTIMAPLGADIVVVQEMQSSAGIDSFRNNVLNVLEPGQWASATFTNGNDTDNALFYKPSKLQLVGERGFYVSVDATRLVNEYRLKPADTPRRPPSCGSTRFTSKLRRARTTICSACAKPPACVTRSTTSRRDPLHRHRRLQHLLRGRRRLHEVPRVAGRQRRPSLRSAERAGHHLEHGQPRGDPHPEPVARPVRPGRMPRAGSTTGSTCSCRRTI